MLANCKSTFQDVPCKCKKDISNERCPYSILFEKDTTISDTLFYKATIFNISDSPQVILTAPTYIHIRIRNHPLIKNGIQVAQRSFIFLPNKDKKGAILYSCKNCFKYYSNNLPFMAIKKGESYTIKMKQHIINLNKLIKGENFLIEGMWYIPEYLESYCPKIWTGSIYSINRITI